MVKAVSKPKASVKSRTSTVAYDVAEQLRTPEEMAAYLDAWLEEAPRTPRDRTALGDIARAKGMTQVARDAGLSREACTRPWARTATPVLRPYSKWRAQLASSSMPRLLELKPNWSFHSGRLRRR